MNSAGPTQRIRNSSHSEINFKTLLDIWSSKIHEDKIKHWQFYFWKFLKIHKRTKHNLIITIFTTQY